MAYYHDFQIGRWELRRVITGSRPQACRESLLLHWVVSTGCRSLQNNSPETSDSTGPFSLSHSEELLIYNGWTKLGEVIRIIPMLFSKQQTAFVLRVGLAAPAVCSGGRGLAQWPLRSWPFQLVIIGFCFPTWGCKCRLRVTMGVLRFLVWATLSKS